ncbi:MAG TPA: glycosyltransferase [Thermoplasmata archaeon]|nr:glycosyltransferase [Thermoplasmata archaeon]HTW77416.1 glycosyltransferase [Thermoplasmata archaeon]
MSASFPIPRSAVVSAYAPTTGVGGVAASFFALGLVAEHLLFPVFPGTRGAAGVRVVRHPLNVAGSGALLSRRFPSRWAAELARLDYAHFATPHFFHLADRPRAATGTVHDLFFLPQYRDRTNSTGFSWYFRGELKWLGRLRAVVTVSRATQGQLAALAPSLPTVVIHPWTGPEFRPRDPAEARARLGWPTDRTILLHVGAASRRKNLGLLAELLDRLGPDHLLVRVGPPSALDDRFPVSRMLRLRAVPPEAYPWLFNAADVVVQPSTAEGFGIPVIEAINSATPVVASRIPVFAETLGREYPYLADPRAPDEWAQRIREIAGAGRERATAPYRAIGDHFRPERGRREYVELLDRIGVAGG